MIQITLLTEHVLCLRIKRECLRKEEAFHKVGVHRVCQYTLNGIFVEAMWHVDRNSILWMSTGQLINGKMCHIHRAITPQISWSWYSVLTLPLYQKRWGVGLGISTQYLFKAKLCENLSRLVVKLYRTTNWKLLSSPSHSDRVLTPMVAEPKICS